MGDYSKVGDEVARDQGIDGMRLWGDERLTTCSETQAGAKHVASE